jgi:hypothetical protein
MPFAPPATHRLVPSRFPPVGAFDTVATTDDLNAVLELEGWTNDRLIPERLRRLSRWGLPFGSTNASVILGAFLHPAWGGSRFNGPELGAWYAATTIEGAVAEVGHHLRLDAIGSNQMQMSRLYRSYIAELNGQDFVDIRGQQNTWPQLYDDSSYVASQSYGEQQRDENRDGILFTSLRLEDSENAVAYFPPRITDVRQAQHLRITVYEASPDIDVETVI